MSKGSLEGQIEEFFSDLPESLRPDAEESKALQRSAVAEHIRAQKSAIVGGLFNVKMAWRAGQEERANVILKALKESKDQLRAAYEDWVALGGNETDAALGDSEGKPVNESE